MVRVSVGRKNAEYGITNKDAAGYYMTDFSGYGAFLGLYGINFGQAEEDKLRAAQNKPDQILDHLGRVGVKGGRYNYSKASMGEIVDVKEAFLEGKTYRIFVVKTPEVDKYDYEGNERRSPPKYSLECFVCHDRDSYYNFVDEGRYIVGLEGNSYRTMEDKPGRLVSGGFLDFDAVDEIVSDSTLIRKTAEFIQQKSKPTGLMLVTKKTVLEIDDNIRRDKEKEEQEYENRKKEQIEQHDRELKQKQIADRYGQQLLNQDTFNYRHGSGDLGKQYELTFDKDKITGKFWEPKTNADGRKDYVEVPVEFSIDGISTKEMMLKAYGDDHKEFLFSDIADNIRNDFDFYKKWNHGSGWLTKLRNFNKPEEMEYDKEYHLHYGTLNFKISVKKRPHYDDFLFNGVKVNRKHGEKFWSYVKKNVTARNPVETLSAGVLRLKVYNEGLSLEQMELIDHGFGLTTQVPVFTNGQGEENYGYGYTDKNFNNIEMGIRFHVDYDSQEGKWSIEPDFYAKGRKQMTWPELKDLWKKGSMNRYRGTYRNISIGDFYARLKKYDILSEYTDLKTLMEAKLKAEKIVRETAAKLLKELLTDFKDRVSQATVENRQGFKVVGESGTAYFVSPVEDRVGVYLWSDNHREQGRYLCIHQKDREGMCMEDKIMSMVLLLLNDKSARESVRTLPTF